MLRNNNMAVVDRMAKQSLKGNKRNSMSMILAVLLSSFMLVCVFTVGVTYFKMQRIQNIRLDGAEFDAIMYGVTDEQLEQCKKHSDIQTIGICAVAGAVEETVFDQTPNVGLMWADDSYWNEMMKPARNAVEGEYPTTMNEVMATKEALKECGLEGLGVGDTFTMTYGTLKGSQEETFRISGMWDGYGPQKVFYMSQDFYKQTGYALSEVSSGRIYMDFDKTLMTQQEQDEFISNMNLGKQQRLFFIVDIEYSVRILIGIIGVAGITCLCAYLLIYNMMYLSVAGNIRYYGLLQTIGMTGKQIYRFMKKQMLFIGVTGIVGGMAAGWGISFFLIPTVVKALGIRMGKTGGIEVSFHPSIFLFTIVLISITIALAGHKPAKTAVMCSPMEALGYRATRAVQKNRKTGRGKLLWRMAKEQLTKDKKKSLLVILSLSTSMSVFLCIMTLISSQGAREYNYTYRNYDIVIKNDTINKKENQDRQQLLDENLLDRISKVEGVKELDSLIYTEITVPWEPEVSDVWMREFYEMWMSIPYEDEIEEYKQYPENFGSSIVGISQTQFQYLNDNLETKVDEQAFLNGEICILYRNSLDVKEKDFMGKVISCAEYNNQNNTRTFSIAGFTDENYYTALLGYPPTMIVSEQAVKEFAQNPLVFKTGVYYDEEYDEETENQLRLLLDGSPHGKDFSYHSKINLMETVRKAQGHMMGVGIGIVLVLALIGIMNYINTSVGGIRSRKLEISMMESIGMTGKQVRRMLILEGILYAAGAWAVTMTVGIAVTYYLFQSSNYREAAFEVPLLPVLAMAICILLVCLSVPIVVYHNMEKKGSVAERTKERE